MEVAAFFHCYVGGEWQASTREFCEALGDFTGPLHVGYVGPIDEVGRAMGVIGEYRPRSAVAAHQTVGYESLTLNAVRDYAIANDGAILYAHTKGAATVEPFRDRWRRSMTNRVVANWRENLALLDHDHEMVCNCDLSYGHSMHCPNFTRRRGVDAVGCHWLTEEQYPGMFGPMTIPAEGSGFFGGNFWMARCDYLRTLPPCEAEPRWKAESWIGINKPRVVDLLPGWPHDRRWPELCG